MTAILCQRCKRPNGLSAKECIWCRAPIAEGATAWECDATTIEADYHEGITRLDDPSPVRLIISREGIEVVEFAPGSRSIKIPVSSIIEVSVAHSGARERQAESPWWQSILAPLRRGSARSNATNAECVYTMAVKYRADDEERTGHFSCSDRDGQTIARKLEHILGKPAADGNHADAHRAHE